MHRPAIVAQRRKHRVAIGEIIYSGEKRRPVSRVKHEIVRRISRQDAIGERESGGRVVNARAGTVGGRIAGDSAIEQRPHGSIIHE